MPKSDAASVQSTEPAASESLQERPTLANQPLETFTCNHQQGEMEGHIDTVIDNFSEVSKDNVSGYMCPHRGCSKRFSRKTRLNAHMQMHYGTQPFKCSHPGCGKAFSEKQNLRIHERIHDDERPFHCPHQGCDKSFRTKGNMRDHCRRHFGDK